MVLRCSDTLDLPTPSFLMMTCLFAITLYRTTNSFLALYLHPAFATSACVAVPVLMQRPWKVDWTADSWRLFWMHGKPRGGLPSAASPHVAAWLPGMRGLLSIAAWCLATPGVLEGGCVCRFPTLWSFPCVVRNSCLNGGSYLRWVSAAPDFFQSRPSRPTLRYECPLGWDCPPPWRL